MSEPWKHTPPPWHWNADGGWVYADVPDGITIGGADCTEYYGGHLVAESVAKANGPLIAAAPDLLAAWEQFMAAKNADETTAAALVGLAAVQKARGEAALTGA